MTVHTVNVLDCELDASLGEAGFEHAAASIGDRLGAHRIGAGVYEAVAERPIWPYHYHYSSEEWLYVIAGAPVLRDAAGRRVLTPGDLVCFPADHRGAHTVFGPGRFIIFSTKASPGPWVSVYPDSDKISINPGAHESTDLNALILPRSSTVEYWDGEGEGARAAPPFRAVVREPRDTVHLPVTNTITMAVSGRGSAALAPVPDKAAPGPARAATGLDATLLELAPGETSAPYHYEHGRETWVLVLYGSLDVRHPDGQHPMRAGDLVSFPDGPDGARQLINSGRDAMRAITFSTTGFPANVCYPDSGPWVLRNGPDDGAITLRP